MQVGSIAMAVVAEMERQGKVMVKPDQTKPCNVGQAAVELDVSQRTVRRLVEAGRLDRIPGTSRMLITVDSIREFQKGER